MKTIDGGRLRNMVKYGVYMLNYYRENLNSLNIFPVPDGDTGTNMSLTSLASLKELDKLDEDAACEAVSSAVASGSLRGARGNSGVILSQLFRGFAKGIKGKQTLTTADFAIALAQSSEMAYKAVMKPKEGTVLTIAREAAQLAMAIAPETEDFDQFLEKIVESSKVVLKQTTDMLPALKTAGVVDAGGKGLLHIYEGFLKGLTNAAPDISQSTGTESGAAVTAVSQASGEEIKFGYCTEFIIDEAMPTEEIMEKLERYLEGVGDSIVAVNDENIIKIHVHTNNPGAVLEYALKIGPLTSVKIDNMRIQHTELVYNSASPAGIAPAHMPEADKTNKNIGVIAISAGEGINGIFRELGCDVIIEGGQTMNPSADDIYKAAESINKQNLIILPNNKNIILAADQAAKLLRVETGKDARVLPTKSIPQGIGSMIAMIHDKPFSETADAMEAGARYIKTGQVTVAVRDTEIDGKTVKTGDYIGIIDGEIIAVEQSSLLAGKRVVEKFAEDCDLVTIYYSDKSLENEGNELSDYVFERALECELYYGGQPVYTYIISAE